jgi:hemimethylated DNA binding protein
MKAYLGDFVRTKTYNFRGRIYRKHHNAALSQEDPGWFNGQEIPISKEEMNEPWYSILVHEGGAVMVSERDIIEIEEPYEFDNHYVSFYFH